jgi:hypothetical protein
MKFLDVERDESGGIIPANQSVMNSEHANFHVYRSGWVHWSWVFLGVIFGMAALPYLAMCSAVIPHLDDFRQGSSASIDVEFSATVAAMADAGPGDAASIERLEKKALGILDDIILSALAKSGQPDLDSLNARLASLGSQEHGFGEAYRVVRLGGRPVVYALAADFGLGSPSAVRLYAGQGSPAHFTLAGEIDRFTQKDMLDDSLELLAVPLPESVVDVVFITVAGRTDELQTGIFTAWRFDGKELTQLWTSDLISHSTFQMAGGNLLLTYCHDAADQDAKTCRNMVREKYEFSIAESKWRLLSTEPAPTPKH